VIDGGLQLLIFCSDLRFTCIDELRLCDCHRAFLDPRTIQWHDLYFPEPNSVCCSFSRGWVKSIASFTHLDEQQLPLKSAFYPSDGRTSGYSDRFYTCITRLRDGRVDLGEVGVGPCSAAPACLLWLAVYGKLKSYG